MVQAEMLRAETDILMHGQNHRLTLRLSRQSQKKICQAGNTHYLLIIREQMLQRSQKKQVFLQK